MALFILAWDALLTWVLWRIYDKLLKVPLLWVFNLIEALFAAARNTLDKLQAYPTLRTIGWILYYTARTALFLSYAAGVCAICYAGLLAYGLAPIVILLSLS